MRVFALQREISAESAVQLRVLKAPAAPTPEKAGGVGCDILRTETVNRTNRFTVSHGSHQAQHSGS
jgi:hypothetical protein